MNPIRTGCGAFFAKVGFDLVAGDRLYFAAFQIVVPAMKRLANLLHLAKYPAIASSTSPSAARPLSAKVFSFFRSGCEVHFHRGDCQVPSGLLLER